MSPIGGIGFSSCIDNKTADILKLTLKEGYNRGFTLWNLETAKSSDENIKYVLEIIKLALRYGYNRIYLKNKEMISISYFSYDLNGNILLQEISSSCRIALQQFSWDNYISSLSSLNYHNTINPLFFDLSDEASTINEALLRPILHYALSKGFMSLILDYRQMESVVDVCNIYPKFSYVVDQVIKDITRVRFEFEGIFKIVGCNDEHICKSKGAPFIKATVWENSNNVRLLYLINTKPNPGLKQFYFNHNYMAYDILNKVVLPSKNNVMECFFEPFGVKIFKLAFLE